ncbi:MAG: YbaK/EbsC family protein [Anaerolineae bacterium]
MNKTNAQRLLESKKIPYESKVYDASGEFHSADEAARLISAPVETVYKTLVVLRETPHTKPLLVMIAANREVDLRGLAKSVGEKKLRMATQKEAEQLTGLQVGGISALALLNRGFEICIDHPALALQEIHISGGTRGLDLKLRVPDLVALTRARTVDATSMTLA